jgi:CRISPR-associated protein Csh2
MSNNDFITNRSEIVFLYDVKDTNPNGDPDENKPRIDNATGCCVVTDVRLKRTVRDFWRDYKGKPIFVTKLEREEDGITYWEIVTASKRITEGKELKDFLKDQKIEASDIDALTRKIMEIFLDIRLFGATIAAITRGSSEKGKTIVRTGPVQFKLGHSLHKVDQQQGEIHGTSLFASKPGAEQGTFRADYILPYALIGFYGIINENNAKHTLATNTDIQDLNGRSLERDKEPLQPE